jgi:D-alanine transfer protein
MDSAYPAEPSSARPPAVHLWATLLAAGLFFALLTSGVRYARGLEAANVHAIAPLEFQLKTQGSAWQRAAFRAGDLLPIYGSSELLVYQGPFTASELFENYPTGFSVFPLGRGGTTSLITLQSLAALGSELRGRKVVLSLSPSWFFNRLDLIDHEHYPGNFSAQHANDLVFSDQLSLGLRRELAPRLLQNPATLANDPLLQFGLARLADDRSLSLALYWAAWPLGRLHTQIMDLQDHWESLAFLREASASGLSEPTRQPARPDWDSLKSKSQQQARAHSQSNPWGFDDAVWAENANRLDNRERTRSTNQFVRMIEEASEWRDLDLLLRGLQELGARPLVLCMPIHGPYYDYLGVNRAGRDVFYRKLRQATAPYGVPTYLFEEHDGDRDFLFDPWSHLNGRGWVFYDQILDAFYHDTLR